MNRCLKCNSNFDEKLNYSFCPFCGRLLHSEITPLPYCDDFSDLSLSGIFQLWKNEHYPNIGKQSIANYEVAWKKLAAYHSSRIDELKTRHYQTVIAEMMRQGYSRSSIEKVRTLISQLCKYAMKNDLITKNYGSYLQLPKKKKCHRNRFSDDELSVLWKNTDCQTVRIILILAYTGLRVSELFKLKREFVFPYNSIPYLIGGSKTDAGRDRTIVISPLILDFIKNEYDKCNEYLISNSIGSMLDLHNWRKRQYYPTLERLNIQKRNIHCLRHTFASMMVKAGADPKSLTELMGHTHISTTADIYAHADFEQLSNAILLLKMPTPD